MKFVVTLFLLLFFSLCGSFHAAKATEYFCNTTNSTAASVEKLVPFKSLLSLQEYISHAPKNKEEVNVVVLFDEDEDEETIDKKGIQERCFFHCYSAFISIGSNDFITIPVAFPKHSSYLDCRKFITQRTLRI